jgi:hypothetical protein
LDETHSFVEADSLFVLFIDVGDQDWVQSRTMPNEGSPNSLPARDWIDEESFHVPFVDQHEGNWIIERIDREPQRGPRQEARHQFVYRESVFARQEGMGGVNCVTPDGKGPIAILRS